MVSVRISIPDLSCSFENLQSCETKFETKRLGLRLVYVYPCSMHLVLVSYWYICTQFVCFNSGRRTEDNDS